ncbi:M56 family metallopeptidase [Prosthecobacter sp.]|jgi:bla regulator protein BlaR1|uniref:M56 family metallopeptidase n=1 Tax=Prosthecobacter sp. TaxID=1965333 RepID=UPI003784FE65
MTTDTLLHWLQRTSLEASLLILAVLGLRLMLGTRLSPAWRIGLWMLVGAKLMFPAFIPAGFGLGSWMQKESAPVITQSSSTPVVYESSEYSASSVGPSESVLTRSPVISQNTVQPSQILLAAWLIGAAIILLAAIHRQRRFDAYLRRRPIARDSYLSSILHSLSSLAAVSSPTIRLMPAGTTPALVGIRQPQILLPEDWQTRFDQRSLRHVLLHELLHVKQSDLLWNWAATAVQALHWFNPLVWFVVSRFQADRELRCDAGALAILSPAERLDYGHTLLRIQETFFAPPAIAGLAPCVRHHPTLRQRILMIATPTTRQPVIQALLVLTLSVLVGYSFTTARAAEKEVPPKVREGSTTQKPSTESPRSTESPKPAMKDGEREGGKPSAERDGQRKPNAERDGEKKPGMRDGERPRTGERDGEKPRTGSRDGEGMKKPGAERDAGTPARKGDGEGRKPSAESSQKPRKGDGDRETTSSGEVLTLKVIDGGDTVLIGDEKVPMNRLRGFLSTFLPDHPGARVEVTGNDDTPLKALHNTIDAVRDNGNKNVGIKAE